ncbi:MAG: hypothetical protein H0W72_16660, partial [Planctomycetes bacterium]|nr:hypothetical protein [Planctomycetota bacterium]
MGEREDIIANLRQLVELDRGFGVEFVPLAANAPSPASVQRAASAAA